jgi:hypothetical protein
VIYPYRYTHPGGEGGTLFLKEKGPGFCPVYLQSSTVQIIYEPLGFVNNSISMASFSYWLVS